MAIGEYSMPVSRLSDAAIRVLCTLNERRLLLSKESGLPRDVRGVANQVQLSTQEAENRTISSVLELWFRRERAAATVYRLLQILETIDRYDIRDDLLELDVNNKLVGREQLRWHTVSQVPAGALGPQDQGPTRRLDSLNGDSREDLSPSDRGEPNTIYDTETKRPYFDAVVVYANQSVEDRAYVMDMMIAPLEAAGFKLADEDILRSDVIPSSALADLIGTRSRNVILVFSPAFCNCYDTRWMAKFANAERIADNSRLIVCELEPCRRPAEFRHYRPLRASDGNFLQRVAQHLNISRPTRLDLSSLERHASSISMRRVDGFDSTDANGFTNGHSSPPVHENFSGLESYRQFEDSPSIQPINGNHFRSVSNQQVSSSSNRLTNENCLGSVNNGVSTCSSQYANNNYSGFVSNSCFNDRVSTSNTQPANGNSLGPVSSSNFNNVVKTSSTQPANNAIIRPPFGSFINSNFTNSSCSSPFTGDENYLSSTPSSSPTNPFASAGYQFTDNHSSQGYENPFWPSSNRQVASLSSQSTNSNPFLYRVAINELGNIHFGQSNHYSQLSNSSYSSEINPRMRATSSADMGPSFIQSIVRFFDNGRRLVTKYKKLNQNGTRPVDVRT